MTGWIVRFAVALAGALLIYLALTSVIRMFTAAPGEAEPEELRPVDYRYRCIVCGAEVTMTAAPGDGEPEPPRHCREDMALVVEADGPE